MNTESMTGTGAPLTGPKPAGAPSAGAGKDKEIVLTIFKTFPLDMYNRLKTAEIEPAGDGYDYRWFAITWSNIQDFAEFIEDALIIKGRDERFRDFLFGIGPLRPGRSYTIQVRFPMREIERAVMGEEGGD
jgi:hypothetical protein